MGMCADLVDMQSLPLDYARGPFLHVCPIRYHDRHRSMSSLNPPVLMFRARDSTANQSEQPASYILSEEHTRHGR